MTFKWCQMFARGDASVVEDTPVFEGFFTLRRLTVRHKRFAGGDMTVTRELFVRGPAVCVLLYDPQRDRVVMVEQFRIGALGHRNGPWMLELVAGIIEPAETPEAVARREAEEESGVALGDLIPITRYLPSPGGSNEEIHLFCAFVDSENAGGLHGLESEGEDIKVHVLPCEQLFAMVKTGQIDNAATIIALQWLQLNQAELKQRSC